MPSDHPLVKYSALVDRLEICLRSALGKGVLFYAFEYSLSRLQRMASSVPMLAAYNLFDMLQDRMEDIALEATNPDAVSDIKNLTDELQAVIELMERDNMDMNKNRFYQPDAR